MQLPANLEFGQGLRSRRGSAIFVALALLTIVGLIAVVLLRNLGSLRETTRLTQRDHQTAWLAESGLERAAAKLASNPSYSGETWTVTPEMLGGDQSGSVTIEVGKSSAVNQRQVKVQAVFPTSGSGDLVSKRIVSAFIDTKP